MDEVETLDVIAVGAHPDDVEIGCGGTLAVLVDQGFNVGIVDLTDGEPTPESPGPEARIAEAHRAAKILGVPLRIILELPNRRLFDNFQSRIALAKVLRRYRPQVVLGLIGKTPMASPDHWQASQITDAAIFYSRLSKWDEHFDGLPAHTISRQVYYSLVGNAWNHDNRNQFVIDIQSTLEKKMESIRCYQTQFPPAKQYVLDRVRAMALAFGAEAGFPAGERLTSVKPIGANNLMHLLQLS